jgi:hypothetical protein
MRLILQGRGRLRLTRNAIFFSWMRLCIFLDAVSFNRCILRCLLQAGILATSGSTGLVAASAALVRGAPLGAVPRFGDWGSAPALFRFCHALYGLVGSHDFPRFRLLTSALSYQSRLPADRIGHLLVRG